MLANESIDVLYPGASTLWLPRASQSLDVVRLGEMRRHRIHRSTCANSIVSGLYCRVFSLVE